MSKGKKILIFSGILLVAGAVLYIVSEDQKRYKYNNTYVPPDYAKEIIQRVYQQNK